MATVQISGLPELLAAVGDDWLEIEEAATGLSYRIKKANLLGAILTGGGTIVTGGHTITVPASGTAALKDGTPAAGNLAMWADADTVEDAGVALTDVPLLDAIQTWTAVQTFPNFKTGQIVLSPDTATTVTPLNTTLCLFVLYPLTGGGGGYNAMVAFRADGSASVTARLLMGANAATTTGVLNGTTGDSNTVTISPHTDGQLYIENRRALSMIWNYAMFSA